MDDLFTRQAQRNAPLADRMRPRNLDEFIGQDHIVGPGRLLRRAIETDSLQSSIFFGPPGCGKTTLINLLMRFYDADRGSIRIDGTPINGISRHSLRESFGMVLQDTWIKRGTVRENIAFGKPEASEDEIIKAAKEGSTKIGHHFLVAFTMEDSSVSKFD